MNNTQNNYKDIFNNWRIGHFGLAAAFSYGKTKVYNEIDFILIKHFQFNSLQRDKKLMFVNQFFPNYERNLNNEIDRLSLCFIDATIEAIDKCLMLTEDTQDFFIFARTKHELIDFRKNYT